MGMCNSSACSAEFDRKDRECEELRKTIDDLNHELDSGLRSWLLTATELLKRTRQISYRDVALQAEVDTFFTDFAACSQSKIKGNET